MKTIGTAATPLGEATIEIGRYPKGGAIYIQLYRIDEDGCPCPMTFSVNLKSYGCELADNEFNAMTWNGNDILVESVMATGLFEDTGRKFRSGFVVSPIWRLRDPALVPEPLKSQSKKGAAA